MEFVLHFMCIVPSGPPLCGHFSMSLQNCRSFVANTSLYVVLLPLYWSDPSWSITIIEPIFCDLQYKLAGGCHTAAWLEFSLTLFLFVGPTIVGTLSGLAPGAGIASAAEVKVGFAPGGGLPSIPASLVEKIRRGDFINFAELLLKTIFDYFVTVPASEKDRKNISLRLIIFQIGYWILLCGPHLLLPLNVREGYLCWSTWVWLHAWPVTILNLCGWGTIPNFVK